MATKQTEMICEGCGSVGTPVEKTKGNDLVELALFLLFCAPGIIYSIWRRTNLEMVCEPCGGKMIPTDSPRGQKLVNDFYPPSSLPPLD